MHKNITQQNINTYFNCGVSQFMISIMYCYVKKITSSRFMSPLLLAKNIGAIPLQLKPGGIMNGNNMKTVLKPNVYRKRVSEYYCYLFQYYEARILYKQIKNNNLK